MPLVEVPKIVSAGEYQIDRWMTSEVCYFYVAQRKVHCSFVEILDLWLQAPLCSDCAFSEPFPPQGLPDILPTNWKRDIAWVLGEDALSITVRERRKDSAFGFQCKRCATSLRPWEGDEVYVVSYHLEDHYRFPLIQHGQIEPSKRTQAQIKALYDHRCFCCRCTEPLHIDHILPRSKGGNAAFRNLQPLCEDCGNKKSDQLPEEVTVYSTMYFGPHPSDTYEGLFW